MQIVQMRRTRWRVVCKQPNLLLLLPRSLCFAAAAHDTQPLRDRVQNDTPVEKPVTTVSMPGHG